MLRPICPQSSSGKQPSTAPQNCATTYPIADRPVSFSTSQNPIVTIGVTCAPLILPIGESAIVAPTEPKKNPLMIRLSVRLGTSATNGLLSANIKMTDDKPINSNKPVPHISAMN